MSNSIRHPYIGYPNLEQRPMATKKIHAYLIWSINNLFFGGVIFGLIAIFLSYLTIWSKRENRLEDARRWSRVTLVFNIIVTILGILAICLAIGLAIGLGATVEQSISSPSSVTCICTATWDPICTQDPAQLTISNNYTFSASATSCSDCTTACNSAGLACITDIVGLVLRSYFRFFFFL